MENRDLLFLGLLAAILVLLLSASGRRRPPVIATVDVCDDTEIVGMSLSPESNPPTASAFKGRYATVPPPLLAMLPTVGEC